MKVAVVSLLKKGNDRFFKQLLITKKPNQPVNADRAKERMK